MGVGTVAVAAVWWWQGPVWEEAWLKGLDRIQLMDEGLLASLLQRPGGSRWAGQEKKAVFFCGQGGGWARAAELYHGIDKIAAPLYYGGRSSRREAVRGRLVWASRSGARRVISLTEKGAVL